MKHVIFYLTLCLFAVMGCSVKEPEPIFKKDQLITYKVPTFYSLTCSGNGKISDYSIYSDGFVYTITTPSNEDGCPLQLTINERDIKAK